MATLNPSGLKTSGNGSQTWMDDYWANWEKLNDELLYLGTDGTQTLQDVDVTAGMGLADNRVLRYNSGTGKWEPWKPHILPITTTTTAP